MTNPSTHSTRNHPAQAGSASSKTMSVHARHDDGRRDVCQRVTDTIVALLDQGVRPWAQSWATTAGGAMPLRVGGERYRGINVLILWAAQAAAGYRSPYWMTYRQAGELGGQVRKGESGTMVVYYGTATKSGDSESTAENESGARYRFLKGFTVFNADQIDGLPVRYTVASVPVLAAGDRMPELEALIASTGAVIHHGGNRAYYRPDTDTVAMPAFEQFHSPAFYYATLFHELAHWTKAPQRLARDFGSTSWGDEGYAKEELVAELAAAFLGAEFGFAPEHIEDHAAYLASWLKALRNDKRLVFMAAAKAQAASDYIVAGPGPVACH